MTLLPTDPKDQRLFLATLASLALAFAYHQFVRKPRTAETDALRTHLSALETSNATARAIAEQQGGPALVARVAELEQHVDLLEKLVPRREEVPLLLREISLRARDTGLQLTRLKPETEEAGEHYVRRTYELNVQGPYHSIGVFLSQVGSLSRIMTPVQLKLLRHGENRNDEGSQVLNANFRLLTYIVPPLGESPADHVAGPPARMQAASAAPAAPAPVAATPPGPDAVAAPAPADSAAQVARATGSTGS